MKTLAIECASEACSVALFDQGQLLAHDHKLLGRGHAEQLIPMIAKLPNKGKANHIFVSRGPGSFTGVRIGIAAARALGIAWGAKVQSYPTLAIVAAALRHEIAGAAASIAMRAGHGEIFIQNFDRNGLPQSEAESLKPEIAASKCIHPVIAGTMAREMADLVGDVTAINLHPDARYAADLPAELFSDDLSPAYCRAPDAKLPGK